MNSSQKVFDAAVRAEESGNSAKALRLYEQAAIIDPAAPHVKLRWASLLYDEGRWKEAIRVARQLTRKWPRAYQAYRLIGSSYVELGRLLLAERSYKQSLAIKQSPITWSLLADVMARLKRNGEPEGCLRGALEVDPDYEEAHYNLGYLYRQKGNLALSEKHLKRAIEIDPRYSLAYAELGQLLSKQNGRTAESVKLLRKAIGYDPNDGWSRAYLANGLWKLRRLKAAEKQYLELMELWPNQSLPYWCFGDFLAYESNDISRAESYLRQAVEIDPRDEFANYSLGNHLLYWDRTKEAKEHLRKAARLGHSRAQERLEEIEHRVTDPTPSRSTPKKRG